jgi:signal transduction histidine kinase
MESRLPLTGTPAEPFLRESALTIEQRIADLRLIAAVFTFVFASIKYFSHAQEYLTADWVYTGTVICFLVYAVGYRIWEPYLKYSLIWSTRTVIFMDFCVALVLIINNGALLSPYWALLVLVALEYTLRFGYLLIEFAFGAFLFFVGVAISSLLDPANRIAFLNVALGVGMIIYLIIQLGMVLVSREREAIRTAYETELAAITRIVNTVQHEVNNPLAAAKGNMMLAHKKGIPEPLVTYFNQVNDALDSISSVVNRLDELEEKRTLQDVADIEIFTLPKSTQEGV